MALRHNLLPRPLLHIFRGRRRGRLVRHYFVLSVVLISGGLITSGLLEIYFRYKESQEQIARLHQEVASGTAFKIERFVQDLEGTIKAATKSREIIRNGLTPEYKFELEKLLIIARPKRWPSMLRVSCGCGLHACARFSRNSRLTVPVRRLSGKRREENLISGRSISSAALNRT
jgi:hypothetical protein